MAMSECMKLTYTKYIERMRQRVWYKRYRGIAELLKLGQCQNPVEVLRCLDSMVNSARGYHYNHVSRSADESLKQVVKDMGWKWLE
jgi:hypothetical protein